MKHIVHKKWCFAFSLFLFLVLSRAHADNSSTKEAAEHPKTFHSDPAGFSESSAAIGLSPQWIIRNDYAVGTFHHFSPELSAHFYLPLHISTLFLRSSARYAYSWSQPEMPKSLRLEERDLSFHLEESLLFDGPIIPSLGMGLGVIRRETSLITSAPIVEVDEDISTKTNLFSSYLHLGLGIPVDDGHWVIEPFFRGFYVPSDRRILFAYGVELSLQIF